MVNVAVPPPSVVVRPEVGVTVMPAVSLSVFVAATSAAFIPLYPGSVLVAAAVTDRKGTGPYASHQITPYAVTGFDVFQFAGVRVTWAGAAPPSLLSLDDSPTLTLAYARSLHAALPISVPPPSVVVRPEVGVTVIPAVSLSVFVTTTSTGFIPLYPGSVLVAAAV